MSFQLAVIEGDGIGPEITRAALEVLEKVAPGRFHYQTVLAGGRALDQHGVPMTDEAMAVCKASDSVLLGAVGGPKWDTLPGHLRPKERCWGIRKSLAFSPIPSGPALPRC